MKFLAMGALILMATAGPASAQYLGNFSANRALPPAVPQPPNTFDNSFGNDSNSPRLYDSQGRFHGNVNNNPYDPDSIANPNGRYGSRFAPGGVNNPNGQFGSRFGTQSPNNPFGMGLRIYGPHF